MKRSELIQKAAKDLCIDPDEVEEFEVFAAMIKDSALKVVYRLCSASRIWIQSIDTCELLLQPPLRSCVSSYYNSVEVHDFVCLYEGWKGLDEGRHGLNERRYLTFHHNSRCIRILWWRGGII